MGKTLAAGYIPVSGIATQSKIINTIIKKMDAIQFSTTHQGHSLGVAAAYAVQKIIHNEKFLQEVIHKGNYLRKTLYDELKDHKFFKNIRGRGLRNSLEYNCNDKHLFGIALTDQAKSKENLLISAKWHRVCFSPAINISQNDLDKGLEKFLKSFKIVASKWNSKNIKKIKNRHFF